ncbi:MAG: CFI-box-CTERM domain-containing protein [bacterium]|nr:hypothetical protein [bacterium]MDT8396902.1 CFI-box-CTERM domain-containing protein [bacterium]
MFSAPDPNNKDNGGVDTGINIVNGFGPLSDADLADYLMTVDIITHSSSTMGYSGTTRAGSFVIAGGTFDDGDDDAWITAGNEVRLSLEVKHAGMPNTARGVRATIDSPDFASVSVTLVNFGDLPALARSTGDGEFVFTMTQPAAAFSWFSVTVLMVDDNLNFSEETFQLPVLPAPKSSGGGGGPCFVATALWGSEHWRTDRLRAFRDDWLITNAPGTWLVDQYYTYSPEPASWVAKRPLVKRAVSFLLERLLWPFFL